MNTITKSRLLGIAVIVLLLANVAVLATFWLKKDIQLPPPPKKPPQGGAFQFLVKELAFDTLQITAYKKLREEHQQKTQVMRKNIGDAKDAFFALVKGGAAVDSITAANAWSKVADEARKLDIFTLTHFQKIRALCTDVQKPKFDSIITQAIKMNAPRGQGPPHPHPRESGDERHDRPPPLQDGDRDQPPPPNDNPPPQ